MAGVGEWTSLVQSDRYVFRPGDGDAYVVEARVLLGTEARWYNASDGALRVSVEYDRRVLAIAIEPGTSELAWSYVAEKAAAQGFPRDGAARHVIAWHHVAAFVAGREVIRVRMTPAQMGWDGGWRDQLGPLLADVATVRRDADGG